MGRCITINTVYKLSGRNPLLFAKDKERKQSLDSSEWRNKLIHNIVSCCLSSLHPCFTHWMLFEMLKWSFFIFASGLVVLGSLGEKVKISSCRVNEEIRSIKSNPGKSTSLLSLAPLPIWFIYTSFSAVYHHFYQQPKPWRSEYQLFFIPLHIRCSLPCAIHLHP